MDPRLSRRRFLEVSGVAAAGLGLAGAAAWWKRHERGLRADVFVSGAEHYEIDLVRVMMEGLRELSVTRREIAGKRILLKPNLVETALGHAHINTHPALVLAAAETFRRLDAAEIIVAEGQGHRRDSWLVLEESGMYRALQEARLSFVDLNHDDCVARPNAGKWAKWTQLYLPQTLLAVDWVVSLPKLKTHHWAGVTCAMKNLFGVMPGLMYGWPKNVLHWQGIPESILDINATVRPALAIVDGIVGMEGDGPIMGTPKHAGCVVMGRNLAAVDATCTRIMGLNPFGVRYLAGASGRLGPIQEQNIRQRGERIARFRTKFQMIDAPHLQNVRAG